MRACSSATDALLRNPPPGLRMADLFTLLLRDGSTTYFWTSYDVDLLVNGQLYSSRKPWLTRSNWGIRNTAEIPKLQVYLRALNTSFAGGSDIKAQIHNGLFDGARLTLNRVFFVPPPEPTPIPIVVNDVVQLPAGGTAVLTETLDLTLSWYQGTFSQSVNDQATMGLGFFDASNVQIGSDTFAPMIDVPVSPDWTLRTLAVTAPIGTKTIRIYMQMHRRTGTSNDGRIDAISLTYSGGSFAVPIVNPTAATNDMTGWTTDLGTPSPAGGVPDEDGDSLFFYGGNSADSHAHQDVLIPAVRDSAGLLLFGGEIADIDLDGITATLNCKGRINRLTINMPRNLFSLGCIHAFCDPGCTLLRASFTTPYTVGSSPAPSRLFIPWSSAPGTPGRYKFGTVKFTSGVASGQSQTVRSADATGITLAHPLYNTPAPGDSFTAFEGCDKALNSGSGQDCTARSNTQHWRGFDKVPPAERAF